MKNQIPLFPTYEIDFQSLHDFVVNQSRIRHMLYDPISMKRRKVDEWRNDIPYDKRGHILLLNEQAGRMYQDIDYYDLIQLPSGGHIPVRIARNFIDFGVLQKIPLSSKIRDGDFFYCEKCVGLPIYDDFGEYLWDNSGYSFFKCKLHGDSFRIARHWSKLEELIKICALGQLKKLRYIKASRLRW